MKSYVKKLTVCCIILIILSVETLSIAAKLQPVASFWGPNEYWRLGYFLSSAGDVNGDGYGDFMIGAYHDGRHGNNAGVVYLMLGGHVSDWDMDRSVMKADFIFYGNKEYDLVGFNISGGGDINGDGFSDILIGSPGNWEGDPYAGEAFIMFGKQEPDWGKNCILYNYADASFIGEDDYEQLGYSVGFAGDINGDGYDDFLIGAAYKNIGELQWPGKAYLVLGNPDTWQQHQPINEDAAASFIYLENEALTGFCVNGVGDVNSDGLADFAISAPGAQLIFLFWGKQNIDWGFDFNLENADIKFYAEVENDDAGHRVCPAGDVNNDGYDDFLISSTKFKQGNGTEGGKTYLILGKANWPQHEISLADVDASYLAEDSGQHAGFGISSAGDVNSDGYDDFLIGARWFSGVDTHQGKAYLIKGKSSGWQRNVSLKDINDFFKGERHRSCAGWGVSTTGDINGDGCSDFIISAPFDSEPEYWAGQVYLFTGSPDHGLCSITGKTLYYDSEFQLAGVTINMSGYSDNSVVTDEAGNYEFNVPRNYTYTIKPVTAYKTERDSSCISAFDAMLAAQISVKLVQPTPLQEIAADVNKDSRVTAYDAALILQHTVGKPESPGSQVGSWTFAPDSAFYDPLIYEQNIQNFQGIVLGDVDGNWSQTDSLIARQPIIAVEEKDISRGQTFTIPINLQSLSPIYAFETSLIFDSKIISFVNIDKTELSADFMLEYNSPKENQLCVSAYAVAGNINSGNYLNINFKVIADNNKYLKVCFNKFVINNIYIKYPTITLSISTATEKPCNFQLSQNYPNPFNAQTKIKYSLPKRVDVKIDVYNIVGESVSTLVDEKQSPGYYELTWNAGNYSSGMYFIKIYAGDYTAIKKMIIIK